MKLANRLVPKTWNIFESATANGRGGSAYASPSCISPFVRSSNGPLESGRLARIRGNVCSTCRCWSIVALAHRSTQ